MPIFRFAMIETRIVEVEYRVEASSIDEAREKAERGETVDEIDWCVTGVSDRFVVEELALPDAVSLPSEEGRTPAAV